MADDVKTYDRTKPFKRINNSDILAKQQPAQADGDGVACGCQLVSDFPDLEKAFEEAFKNFKPGSLQNVVHKARQAVDGIVTAVDVVAAVASATGVGAAAGAAAKKVGDVVKDILDTADDEIKKLLQQIGLELAKRAIQVMPQWVPVLQGASNDSVTADQVIEVEGVALRSYLNPIDVPFRQWHLWFNWNVNVVPEPQYQVRANGVNDPPNLDHKDDSEDPILPLTPQTVAVQWDTGAMGDAAYRSTLSKGVDAGLMPTTDGPMLIYDWAWPLTNSYVWATGRWVYDCSQTTDDTPPKMRTMINPCKAVASARWQAFQFDENDYAVPAIQFSFFASKHGGYIDFPAINDQDYEFIVDLPPSGGQPYVPFPIGHTPDFPHNTIVLRPALLVKVDQDPYKIASTAKIDPIVELIYPDDPQQMPQQVKVTVPLTTLAASDETCGFILSMGWLDPDNQQAKKVKKCSIAFTYFSGIVRVRNSLVNLIRNQLNQDEQKLLQGIRDDIGKINVAGGVTVSQIPLLGGPLQNLGARMVKEALDLLGELDEEDWLLRLGVNGQWQSRYFDGLKQSENKHLAFRPALQFDALLADEDLMPFAVNGADFGPVGSMMREEAGSRTLKVDGNAPKWSEIVNPDPDPDKAKAARQKMAIAYALALLGKGDKGFGLGRDNQPLGFLDPIQPVNVPSDPAQAKALEPVVREHNPITAGRAGTASMEPLETQAFFARAIDPQKILVEDHAVQSDPDGKDHPPDYLIGYSVSISDQLPADQS